MLLQKLQFASENLLQMQTGLLQFLQVEPTISAAVASPGKM